MRKYIVISILLALFTVPVLAANAYTTRTFYMGLSVLMPHDLTNPAVDYMYNTVRGISDLDYWHFDSGAPWPEAYASLPYQTRFQNEIDFKVLKRNAGSKLYLAVNALNSTRTGIALYESSTTSNDALPGVWAGKDFDDPMVLAAYLNYARYMINKFNPDYFNFGIEANSLAKNNPASFEKFVPFAAQVYSTLKAEYPRLTVFMSFSNNEDVWPDLDVVKRLLPYSDIIGLSFYPYRDPALISDRMITDIRNLDPNKKLAFTEFGYTAESFTIFGTPITGSVEWQNAFLERFLTIARKERCEFVCWFLLRDYDAILALFIGNPTLYEQSKAWCYSGFYDFDGTERPALSTWKAWLALPADNAIPAALNNVVAYPNPFRPGTNSAVYLTNLTANASLTICSSSGERIRSLTATSLGLASWDAKDSSGNTVPNGVYLALIEGNGTKAMKKVAIIK